MTLRDKTDMRGFTLLEVIIAILLLAVAFMGLASMTAMVVNGHAFTKMSTTAAALASSTMEDLKSRSFSDARVSSGAHADAGNPINGIYTRVWNVADVMNAANTGVMYKNINLTVTWIWQNKTRSVSLSTLKANSI